MNRLLKQRYAIKFCLKLGKTVSETQEMIKSAYGDDAMGPSLHLAHLTPKRPG